MATHSLRSFEGWLLAAAGLIWLGFAAEGGVLRGALAGGVGALGLGTGVAALLLPGDLRVPAYAALGALAGIVLAVLGLFAFGVGTSLGLAVVSVVALVASGRLSLAWVAPTVGVPQRIDETALAAKVAADEALLATFHLRIDFPRGAALAAMSREALELRDWLRDGVNAEGADPLAYHRVPPPLAEPRSTRQTAMGRDYEHLSCASDWEPLPGEPGRDRWSAGVANRTAHAYVVRTDPAAPWLVAINGYRMGLPSIDLAVFDPRVYCERLGLNLLVPVLPLHGPRRIGRLSGDGYLDGDLVTFVHAEGQAMWDVRRWIGWIRAQGGERIGAMGLSLGGYNCALLAALEADLSCAIAGIPVADFARILAAHSPPWFLRELSAQGLGGPELAEIVRPVSPLTSPPLLAKERLAVFAGVGDRVVPPEHQRDLIAHWQPAAVQWYQGGHITYRLDPAVQAMVNGVLRENLLAPEVPRAAAS